jgi:hypothetical protein
MNLYLVALLGLLLIILIIVSPLLSIWALNTLFSLSIPTNIWTYLATLWLHIVIGGSMSYKKS